MRRGEKKRSVRNGTKISSLDELREKLQKKDGGKGMRFRPLILAPVSEGQLEEVGALVTRRD